MPQEFKRVFWGFQGALMGTGTTAGAIPAAADALESKSRHLHSIWKHNHMSHWARAMRLQALVQCQW